MFLRRFACARAPCLQHVERDEKEQQTTREFKRRKSNAENPENVFPEHRKYGEYCETGQRCAPRHLLAPDVRISARNSQERRYRRKWVDDKEHGCHSSEP